MKRIFFVVLVLAMTAGLSASARAAAKPLLIFTPDTAAFAATRVGQTSAAETITVTKEATNATIKITSLSLSDHINFTITSDSCTNAKLNKKTPSCTVEITFNPQERGHFAAALAFVNTGKEPVQYLPLSGEGTAPEVVVSTNDINFGEQTVGMSSSPHEVLLVNSGTAQLAMTDIAITGEFDQTNDCGTAVDAGNSCGIDITFTPAAVGDTDGLVTITNDAADSPQEITLSGTGINPGSPDVSLSTHVLDFGSQLVDTTSTTDAVIVTNTGTVNVTFTSIEISGDFDQTNNCTSPLVPGANCTVEITFSPSESGTLEGILTITDDAGDSPQTVTLSGIGITPDTPSIQLSANVLNFKGQIVGTSSEEMTLTLTNNGTADVVHEVSTVTGEEAHSFSTTDHCAEQTLTIGRSCTIDVVFTPASDGTFTAALTITSNASESPQTVSLTGIGTNIIAGGSGCSLMPSLLRKD